MNRPLDKLAEALASALECEDMLMLHTPVACEACAAAFTTPHHVVCGDMRDLCDLRESFLSDAAGLMSEGLWMEGLNEDEEDLLQVSSRLLDSYRSLGDHRCPECALNPAVLCPDRQLLWASITEQRERVGSFCGRIVARACTKT